MWILLLGPLASLITGSAITSQHEPADRPQGQVELPLRAVGAGPGSEAVQVRPFSEFKFEHIVRQAYDYSCGSAALTTVLRSHLGHEVTEQQAMEGMLAHGEREKIVERRGFSLLDMKRYAATLGSDSAGFRGSLDDLRQLKEPAIVPIDYAGFKHFVVLRGVREGRVYLADPAIGHLVMSEEAFAPLWDRNTLFIVYPSRQRPPFTSLLALGDRELGVVDSDTVRDTVRLAPPDRHDALERAVQQGLGQVFFRRP